MEKDIRFVIRFYREGRLNTSQAWKKLGIQPEKNRFLPVYRIMAIAAVACLVAGFSWWWMYEREDWVTFAVLPNTTKEVILPDSTYVTLGGNATLRYERLGYGREYRNVHLTGKAFFAVHRLEQCPFTVETKLASVQVLGTRFQVIAHPDSTLASVESGKVCFRNRSDKEAILTKGMKATSYADGNLRVADENNPNVFAWRTYEFIYNETDLRVVIKELEEAYQIRISNVPQEKLSLTVSFHRNSIDEILDVINQTLNTNLTKR